MPHKEKLAQQAGGKSIEVHVMHLQNNTTHADPADDPRLVRFVEYTEDCIRFQIPKQFCSMGHNLEFTVLVKSGEDQINMEGTGKVQEMDVKGEFDTILLHLVNYDIAHWKEIVELFESKQTATAALFERLKGY